MTNPSLDLAVALGRGLFRLAEAHRRTPHRRRHRPFLLPRRAGCCPGGRERRGSSPFVCVVPQHLEEGQEIALAKPELELSLGQPVSFPLYTSTVRGDDRAGDLLRRGPGATVATAALQTILRGGKRSGTKQVPVTLAARSTAIGTLELYCVAREGGNRWRLEFNVRDW